LAIDWLQLAESVGGILGLATAGIFATFILFGQRIQYRMTLRDIGRAVDRLDRMSGKAKRETAEYLTRVGRASEATATVDRLVEYATIMPEDLDPTGIVPKIEHITNTGDERIRSEIRDAMKDADAVSLSIAQNLLELSSALNLVHKVVRHF
jgi:hypothetical protein